MPSESADYLRLSPDGVAELADWWPNNDSPRAFGGQIIGHAIMACGRVAPAGSSVHSVHVHFLRPGLKVDTRYEVTPVREGRSYALYRVDGVEVGTDRQIASAVVSFCRPEAGAQLHTDAMPTCEELPTAVADVYASEFPHARPGDTTLRRWSMRWTQGDGAGGRLSASSSVLAHAAAVGFLSDWAFLLALKTAYEERGAAFHMTASLDHALHFHAPSFDATAPLLYVQVASLDLT
jgi:acyl-CoA thioesterase-2